MLRPHYPSNRRLRRQSSYPVISEPLESRRLLSLMWTGGGSNNLWSNANNWINTANNQHVAPAGNFEALVFPATASQRTARNDLGGNLAVGSLTIDSTTAYTISGNAISLRFNNPGFPPSGIDVLRGTHTLSTPIVLAGGQTTTLGVETGATLNFTSVLDDQQTPAFVSKAGGGTLALQAASPSYDGQFTVLAGTVRVSNSQSLGRTQAGTIVRSGGTLLLESGANGGGDFLTIAGNGAGGQGAVRAESTVTWNGRVRVDFDFDQAQVNVTTGNTLTLAGTDSVLNFAVDAQFPGHLDKTGGGRLTVAGGGAFVPDIRVQGGFLRLGPSAGSNLELVSVSSGAAMEVTGGISVPTFPAGSVLETLRLAGTGPSGAGALVNLAGDNTLHLGTIDLTADARIASLSGTLTLDTEFVDTTGLSNVPAQLTLNTAVAASNITITGLGVINGSGSLRKTGAGTAVLSGTGNNTFAGSTQVQGGFLNLRKSSALGGAGGTSVSSGAAIRFANIGLQGIAIPATEALTLAGSGPDGNGALQNPGGINSWAGPVTLSAAARIESAGGSLAIDGNIDTTASAFGLTVAGNGDTLFAGAGALVGAGSLTKLDAGTLTLGGLAANTYTGRTFVSVGTVKLQKGSALGSAAATSDTVVSPQGMLVLNGLLAGLSVPERLTVSGSGLNNQGALFNSTRNNAWTGPVAMAIDSSIGVALNTTLTITGAVSGAAILTKVGTGTLVLANTGNTNTNDTIVSAGRLLVTGTVPGRVLGGAGTTVGGTGTIRSLNVGANCVLQPGVNGPGRLTVETDLVIAGRMEVDLTAGGSDQVRVTNGNVTISPGVQLTLIPAANFAAGTSFTIIDNIAANGITTGNFANTTINVAGQVFVVVSVGNDVQVRVNTPATFPDRKISSPINEGDNAMLTGRIGDPDIGQQFILEVNWGDGGNTQKYVFKPTDPRTIKLLHRYVDGGDYDVALIWRDNVSGQKTDLLHVHVNNVAPKVDAGGNATLGADRLFQRTGKFTDPGRDTWTATVDYGDGNGPELLRLNSNKTFALQHKYTRAGQFKVIVRITDEDGGVGTDQFILTVLN